MTSLAMDLACALDAAVFSTVAGVTPDDWQAKVLRSTAPGLLLNCSRQSGKSLTAATLAIHVALYAPGSLTLMLSPSQRQSTELFRKALSVYRAAGRPVPSDAETVLRLELSNGSRVVALPGSEASVRGFSAVDLLIVDEASRVDDALFYAVRPMLAVSGGRVVALSTPFGKRGWWFEAWTEGGDHWQRFRIEASDCPRISEAFLNEERRLLPEMWFQQEYCCQFVEIDSAVFGAEVIQSAISADVLPLFGAA